MAFTRKEKSLLPLFGVRRWRKGAFQRHQERKKGRTGLLEIALRKLAA